MTRKDCLDAAAKCVLQDRASEYGGPEDNFGRIALLWADYLGVKFDAVDVAMMMALLKIARVRNNKAYEDGFVDLAGYAACGAELASAMKAREDATREAGEEYLKLKLKAKDNHPENPDSSTAIQPKFQPGDSLLVTMPDGEDMHCIYVGESKNPGCCCVRYLSGDNSGDTDDTVPIDQLRRVPVSKAEGCEELVQRIKDVNPDIYGAGTEEA